MTVEEKKKKHLKCILDWAKANKEKCAEYKKRWLEKNRHRRKEICERYRKKNRDKIKEKYREWAKLYPNWYKNRNMQVKAKLMNLYGGKCVNPNCSETELAVLTIDHINDDGAAERKVNDISGPRFYGKLLKIQKRKDLQILCHNCQYRKRAYGRDFSEWPLLRTECQRIIDSKIKGCSR